jgi:hypothetical protein
MCVETIAATCELTGVHMDTAVRKSTPFPPSVRERAAALIVATGDVVRSTCRTAQAGSSLKETEKRSP